MTTPTGNDHWVNFGDGLMAQILDTKEYIKQPNGVKHVKFILLPTRLVEQTYDIADKQDMATRAVVMEYPATEVVWLTRGTGRSRCWIFTDFMGGPTPASRRQEELAGTLRDTERLLRSAEAAKNRAYQELEKERQQQMQALQTKINMVRAVARARGRVEGEGGDEDGEEIA